MSSTKDTLVGEVVFRTIDGSHALIYVYRSTDTFKLRRMMPSGGVEERANVDVHHGDLRGYASEAALKWSDLDPESAELKPAEWK